MSVAVLSRLARRSNVGGDILASLIIAVAEERNGGHAYPAGHGLRIEDARQTRPAGVYRRDPVDRRGNTRTTGAIRCDRPRVLDLAARNGRRLESVSAAIIDEVLAGLAAILA